MKRTGRLMVALTLIAAMVFALPLYAKQQPPKPEKMKKLSFPHFKEFKTKNNIDVIVVEHHEQPVVTIEVVIKTGASLDPADKADLADFTVNLLNKGTKDKDSNELAKWIESVGGTVDFSSGDDWLTIYITVLSEYIDTAYEYLKDILMNPTFPQDELEQYRKRTKTALELEKSQPSAVARRHFYELVYGDHPYALSPTPETVEAITREDILDFFKKNFVANNALIAVVGDVKEKEVKKDMKKYFGTWKEGNPGTVEYPTPPSITQRKIYLYHKPGAVQTTIRVGHLGLRPTDPAWPKVVVANRILGGGADARLFMDLREDKGWTYGAYSRFSKPKDIGVFSANVDVRTEVTDSALVELLNQLKKITEEPVTDEELQNAKSYLIGNFPITLETPTQIARQIVRVKLLGLGKDYLEKYRDKLAAVTADDVSWAMKTYLHPDNAVIVLVGDATKIYDKVKDIAPVSLFDLDGNSISIAELSIKPVEYAYDGSVFKDVEATYSLSMQQMAIGEIKVGIKRAKSEGKDIVRVTSSIAGMFALDQTLEFAAGDMAPISYKSKMAAGPNVMSADLSFENGQAKGTIKGMKDKEGREISTELVKGTILDDEIEFALAALPLEVDKEYSFPTFQTDSGSMSNVVAKVVGEEEVTVPAGKFSTYKIRVKTPDGEIILYSMKEKPHMLVKHEIPAQGLKMELKQLSK